jgi:arylsulfatase A-like enzyme
MLVLLASSPWAAAAQEVARPNVVVVLADDQGWGDLSYNGNTSLHTPRIDSLAREGAAFDRFYVCAVCAPTRAEFVTGRYHPRGGVRGVSTGQERLNPDEKTIAHAFKAAGYATAAIGKWHNGSQWPYHPLARGFDEYYGFTSGHWGEYFDPPLEHNGKPVRGRGYVTDDFTDRALAFIDANRDRPFFCYVAYNTPHSPFAVPEAYWNRFKDKPIEQRASEGEENLDITRCVLAMCENIDDNVGRVLKRLDELQLAENTIVVYFSDNGPNSWRWNGGMKGRKGSVDEGGVRAPCFVRWPARIKPGTVVHPIAGAIDLLPTLAALTGIEPVGTQPLDGRDISPLLLGREVDWPERMIFSLQNKQLSVRTQQYRLDPRGALFDMTVDPGQRRDIAAERPEVANSLRKAAAAWRAEVLDPEKQSPDKRPYPVGYPEFPMTPLPARDGVPHGTVRRSSSAPNCSYFVNWTSVDDRLVWDVAVQTTGHYEVTIDYTCPQTDAGATVELSFGESRLTGKVEPAWDPPLYTNQDTLPRPPAESTMKEFRPLRLGTVRLEAGRGPLALRAVDIPGKTVMDLRRVTLTLQATDAPR